MKITRRNIHLWAGLVMFSYVTCHLLNHAMGVISLQAMENARRIFIDPWTTLPMTTLLTVSVLTHIGSALWLTYRRRSLRMPFWEWFQLALGLSIPPMLVEHALATGGAMAVFGTNPTYAFVLANLWAFAPWKAVMQTVLLVTAWLHACFGLHHLSKFYDWYQKFILIWFALALTVPVSALMGFAAAGVEVRALAADQEWITAMIRDLKYPGSGMDRFVADGTISFMIVYCGLLVFVFLARQVRIFIDRKRKGTRVTYPSGRRVLVPKGGTVLETSRAGGIPHASVCGGRGRCSTCRFLLIQDSTNSVPPPKPAEARILTRLKLSGNVRLACQVYPKADITIETLLPPDVTAKDALQPGKFQHGQEQTVAVMFADLRGFTQLSEKRLPFDVVFLLNRYFKTMGTAITESGGRVDKFIGDGIMALFGLDGDVNAGARAAIEAARRMGLELERINESMRNDLDEPLRLGIGLHLGQAIVGTMGYGETTGFTAIGDTVNTASRLEGLTKEVGCQVLLSASVRQHSGYDLSAFPESTVSITGRADGLHVVHVPKAELLPERPDE